MPGEFERGEVDPFALLGVGPEASRAEVERAGRALLDGLALGLARARSFRDARGRGRVRDAESVRAALAQLRDPDTRLVAELLRAEVEVEGDEPPLRFENALERCGFGGPS